jgi:ATP-dependent helicase/nuclease subunit A
LLARWLRVSGDLQEPMTALGRGERNAGGCREPSAGAFSDLGSGGCTDLGRGERHWTDEQRAAIERRDGDLLLAAGAGSGKTAVLVERFVRGVLEDGIDVSAILTITFTEKAAAEMRDRIRVRLRELGAIEEARATEGAFISTIHGFCARVLRAHALLAGIDPSFVVLDEAQSRRLARAAFDAALEELAVADGGVRELIAAHGPAALRGAIGDVYADRRSRGELDPALPPVPPAAEIEGPRARLRQAATELAVELDAVDSGARVVEALERLGHCDQVVAAPEPWPGDLDRLALPGGNGAALSTPACDAYTAALSEFRQVCAHRLALQAHAPLGRLLRSFSARYRQAKRVRSGLDFEDLELMTRDLLLGNDELRERYQARFARIMVDELQDTNPVQLEVIESIASENLFMVGDSQQSIYGFRGADVELFERRAERLDGLGALARLQTNFRSHAEILEVINEVFSAPEEGERFAPLIAGRRDPPLGAPAVELLLVDKTAKWAEDESLASPWRLAEARVLAARVSDLLEIDGRAGDIVLLTRAATDLRVYERALEDRGVPTYLIGGRGYWSHPQVIDLVAYLRALANPRDEEALYTVLASPIVGVSVDALVVLAAGSREAQRDPWWTLREPAELLVELASPDRERLVGFREWFAAERDRAPRHGLEELIDRALELSGYDLAILAMAGGRRRLANIRKLMRLAREYELTAGRDLRGFLDQVAGGEGPGADPKESEAPVEGEALDAVRLMTIHRAKGLEFETVCLADLGRGRRYTAELMRVGRDGRFGVRLAQAGSGKREPALDYQVLRQERIEEQRREERRLMYVAMTRAKERLILSGAARLDKWPEGSGGAPIGWLGPALVPDLESTAWVELTLCSDPELVAVRADSRQLERPGPRSALPIREDPPGRSVMTLSYSALGEYRRCGYRFYAERVLGLLGRGDRPGAHADVPGAHAERPVAHAEQPGAHAEQPGAHAEQPGAHAKERGARGEPSPASEWTAAERGVVIHGLLERLDFGRPVPPSPAAIAQACERAGLPMPAEDQAKELRAAVAAFAGSALRERLGRATQVRREQQFGFLLGGESLLITGAIDVLAREPGGMLVVDYKSDRLAELAPAEIVAGTYATQRLIYALAVLRSGAEAVDVVHVFLESPQEPVSASFSSVDVPALEDELGRLTERIVRGDFRVTEIPHRAICEGCPAEGGLCSWPLEMTRRGAPDTLF